MTKQDRIEFNAYLANCTDAQVQGVYAKETQARRMDYAALAYAEMQKRGLG